LFELTSDTSASLPDKLDQATLEVVGATAPAIAANIETITRTFYPHMFETHPCTRNYFNTAHQVVRSEDGSQGAQPFALAHAILR
jgi:nitric oxide dioxygenase